MEVGGEGDYVPIATLSPHRISDVCIDLGSDGSHFCVSFIISCEGQSLSELRRQCPQPPTTTEGF